MDCALSDGSGDRAAFGCCGRLPFYPARRPQNIHLAEMMRNTHRLPLRMQVLVALLLSSNSSDNFQYCHTDRARIASSPQT